MRRRPGAMRLLGFGFALSAIAAATGCNTHQCDPSTVVLGQDPSPVGNVMPWGDDGQIRWESSPINGPWLDFPGQRRYVLYFPQPFVSPPDIATWLSADPGDAQGNFVQGGANLAQFSEPTTTSITVFNPSCAEYGLRVVATGYRATGTDAGNDDGGDGGSRDSPSE